jgi:hypothetical protein
LQTRLLGIISSLYLLRLLLLLVSLQVGVHAVRKKGIFVHLTKVEHMLPVRHNYHNAQHAFLQLSYVIIYLLDNTYLYHITYKEQERAGNAPLGSLM